tara:strand:- start:134 stop:355 length:222 start_codon:yes stop_codon:yes gene_type:complete
MYNEKTNQVTDWPTYIKKCNEVGLSSPTPYKVIPYKNGIGVKQIIFLNSNKKCCLPFDHTKDQKDSHDKSLIK